MSDMAFEWHEMRREVRIVHYQVKPSGHTSSGYRKSVGLLTLVAILCIIVGFAGSLLAGAYWADDVLVVGFFLFVVAGILARRPYRTAKHFPATWQRC